MKEEIAKQVQVYAYNNTQQILQFAQTEKVIYGSSRLGTNFNPIPLFASQNSTQPVLFITHNIGLSTYELTNHLGNVLSVISDKPIPHQNGQTVDYWLAEVRQATDYSPFGVQLQTRNLFLTVLGNVPYRYAFQGQERDDEIKGAGNSYNYEYRMHDPRLGRFFAIDPLTAKYPKWTPYAFSGNQVIATAELEGLEPKKDLSEANVGQTFQARNQSSEAKNVYNWIIKKTVSSYDENNNPLYSYAWEQGSEYTGPTKVENANMAEHVYTTDESNVTIGKSYATNSDYKLIAKFNSGEGSNGFKAALYVRDIDGTKFYNLAFAGTDDWVDGLDDASAGLGYTNGQLVLAKYLAQQVNSLVKKADNGNNLGFTGHSLGGGLAAIASFATGRKSTTFNAMGISTSTGLMNGLSTTNASKLITAYIIRGEALNAAQPTKANGFKYMINGPVGNSAIGAHSISNFTKLWNKK